MARLVCKTKINPFILLQFIVRDFGMIAGRGFRFFFSPGLSSDQPLLCSVVLLPGSVLPSQGLQFPKFLALTRAQRGIYPSWGLMSFSLLVLGW